MGKPGFEGNPAGPQGKGERRGTSRAKARMTASVRRYWNFIVQQLVEQRATSMRRSMQARWLQSRTVFSP